MADAPVGAREWWADSVGYEIYVPSFADSNGDGWGDLPGITSRLGYLADLGVDLLWLTPIHPSPFADHGYDVADYLAVNPRFGTLADLEALLESARGLGLRVLLDLVPNHTSAEHEWFRASRRDRRNPYRDYYLWRDPGPDGGPPNNWVSVFGGPAWTYDDRTGQYYLHLFAAEQPDLNWRNPAVAEEFDAIMRWWLDVGFAGFRVDVPHVMLKHPDLPDNPALPAGRIGTDVRGMRDWLRFEHRYDLDQPGVVGIHRRWRQITQPRGAMLLGEVNLTDPARLARYTASGGLDAAFWFGLIQHRWEPEHFGPWVREASLAVPGLAWVLSSHDRPRAASRYGGGARGRRRALMMATLIIGLPALPFLYQGDELGLTDAEIAIGQVQDPLVLRGGAAFARDAVRTPMPWSPTAGAGFTSAARAWIPLGNRRPEDTVAVQARDPSSPLRAYRRLLRLRRACPQLRHGRLRWLDAGNGLLAYLRDDVLVAANPTETGRDLALPAGSWHVAFSTGGHPAAGRPPGVLRLPGEHAVILASV